MEWTPYQDKMKEQLIKLSLTEINQWGDKDFRPAADMNNSGLKGTCRAFGTEKLKKIGIGSFFVKDELQCGMCTIFPQDGYDLPIFFSRWEEREKDIIFLVDFIPTVDDLVDEDYRVKYIESMDALWQKYAGLAGICPEENDAVRSVCSIIYTAARVPVENEGLRLAALAPHTTYLKHYLEFITSASPVAEEAKRKEIARKTKSVKGVLSNFFRECAGNITGSDTAELLQAIFY